MTHAVPGRLLRAKTDYDGDSDGEEEQAGRVIHVVHLGQERRPGVLLPTLRGREDEDCHEPDETHRAPAQPSPESPLLQKTSVSDFVCTQYTCSRLVFVMLASCLFCFSMNGIFILPPFSFDIIRSFIVNFFNTRSSTMNFDFPGFLFRY